MTHPDWDEQAPSRSEAFIYMDKETIDHLASAILPGEPGEPETVDQKYEAATMHWVKVVDVSPEEPERRHLRLRLWDLLDVFVSASNHGGLSTWPTEEPRDGKRDDAPAETQCDWPILCNN